MLTLERQNEIMEYLKQKKTATVRELAARLYVSDATIRRDLGEMETLGLLRRSHGGAVLLEKNRDELSVLVRMEQNADAKRVMSELVIPELEDCSSVWMDSSSTVHFLSTVWRPTRKTVFTTGVQTALELAKLPDMQVVMPGGVLKFHTDSLEGEVTREQMRAFFADAMVCSCGGIGTDGVVTESTLSQCAIKQGMMQQSRRRILVADSSKIGETRAFRIGTLRDFHVLVCDRAPDDAVIGYCRENGVRLVCRMSSAAMSKERDGG